MRLSKYLINEEENEIENITKILVRDCKPFLKEFLESKCNGFLWRGTHKFINSIEKITPRSDRKPRDMEKSTHNDLNTAFKNKFGWNVRSGIFTIGRRQTAQRFGSHVYMFFPVGSYKYVWSKTIYDLYSDITERGFNVNMDKFEFSSIYGNIKFEYNIYKNKKLGIDTKLTFEDYVKLEKEKWEKERINFINSIPDKYINDDLKRAIESKYEVTFNCKEYYLINRDVESMLMTSLKGLKI